MSLKKFISKCYKKSSDLKIIATAAFFAYSKLTGIKNKNSREFIINKRAENESGYEKVFEKSVFINDVKIAFVCDDMTYECFSLECKSVFLTPENWFKVMEEFRPDIFFCESAWSGIKEYNNCWRGKIYKNENVIYETRKVLFSIIEYCKRHNIKTVFWNKEDPTYFGNFKYNFIDTALKFEYIFTTCGECVDKYKALGAKNVDILMFGFSPKIFNPLNCFPKNDEAVFAGSWYNNEKERCNDMENIFDSILNENINLKIYDRYFNTYNPDTVFPKKYLEFNKGSLPFSKLGEIIKKAKYAVNINTVKNSKTMFARRVFELIACNTAVISNFSQGLKEMFGDGIWFAGEKFSYSLDILQRNLYYVFENHTNYIRIKHILEKLQISFSEKEKFVAVIYKENATFNIKEHFNEIKLKNKRCYIIKNGCLYEFEKNCIVSVDFLKNKFSHFIFFDKAVCFDFEKAFVHYSYLDDYIGIKFKENENLNFADYTDKYKIISDNINENVIFSVDLLENLYDNFSMNTKKYII